jgi:hypothetical protein
LVTDGEGDQAADEELELELVEIGRSIRKLG